MLLFNSGFVACGAVLWGAASLCFKGMLVNTNPLTQLHIPEDLNPRQKLAQCKCWVC